MPSLPTLDSARDADIAHAAQRLLDGELAAFPTETVYGLGADAENPQAVADHARHCREPGAPRR